MHVVKEWEYIGFPIWKEYLPILYQSCRKVKRGIGWPNIGTLIVKNKRMLECIHMKF
jgi:hypothetical protein